MQQAGLFVCKFGGTSLANAEMFQRVAEIVHSDPRRRIVVPSAPAGITNRLLKDIAGRRCEHSWKDIELCFLDIESSLELKASVRNIVKSSVGLDMDLRSVLQMIYDQIEGSRCDGHVVDYIVSRGEFLNGLLLAALLGYEFVDAADVIKFDNQGKVDPVTYDLIAQRCRGDGGFVIPGFYGAGPDSFVETFSRGGSDITGAIAANALDALVYENWTDVTGVMMADPRIVNNPKEVSRITYSEMQEMAITGANVLHADSVLPAMRKKIPINVRCTLAPGHPGTWIVEERENNHQPIVGVVGRKGFSTLYFAKYGINGEVGVVRDVLNVFAELDIPIDVIPTGVHEFGISAANKQLEGKTEKLLAEIAARLQPDKLSISQGYALVAVVGLGMAKHPGTAAKIFSAMAEVGANIRTITQTPSENSIVVGVDEDLLEIVIRAVYQAFC